MENSGLFALEPTAADGAFAADDEDRHRLDKAVVWVGGLSDVAREPARGGVFFFAFSDWAEEVSTRHVF